MATLRSTTGAALLWATLAAGCALIPDDTPSDSLIGAWVVEDIDGGGVTDNANLTMGFDETGRVFGGAGCNRFTGAYTFDATFGTLKITPLGVTRRLCPPAVMTQERKLIQSVQAATRAESRADGSLALTSPQGRLLLRRSNPGAQVAAAKPAPTPAPAYNPAADPMSTVASSASAVSPTALPPPSTSSYPLAGGPGFAAAGTGAAAPLFTPTPAAVPVGAPMSTVPVYATQTPVIPAPVAPKPAVLPAAAAPQPAPYVSAIAAPAVSRRITASGDLFFLEQIALPPDAVVRVQLRDVSRVGAPATVLGEQQFSATAGQPFPFSVTAPVSVIGPNARLTLFAQILSGNRLLYITDTSNPVPLEGTTTPLHIRLVSAAPARPRIQPPRPAPIITPAVTPTVALPVPPTPAIRADAVSWRCRNETFRIAFDDRSATLTNADGATALLARIDATDDPAAPRMFSNSNMTLMRDADGGRVRFARGRMALTTCTKAE